ncbi:hypothetical protein [Gordonia bronchialis]|uniref:hypothetical protein n=1 Tax=Gordonia bronchialis TaxID=2054 RepID=UPI0024324FD8|nr:hypothetical protein [Gordonia bronchialis]
MDSRRGLRRRNRRRSVTLFLDTYVIAHRSDNSLPEKQLRAREVFIADATTAVTVPRSSSSYIRYPPASWGGRGTKPRVSSMLGQAASE